MHQMDQELQTSIKEELKYDPVVVANDVVVTVSNGTVRLSGEVTTLPEKLAANRSAMRVRGVRAVANELTVRHPGNTDVDLTEMANKFLTRAVDVPPESIKARVSGHVITLSGTVAWQYQRDAATRAVMNLPGATAVTNQITLTPPESAAEGATRVRNDLVIAS
jgi:osmotically-inducible protein OsmY